MKDQTPHVLRFKKAMNIGEELLRQQREQSKNDQENDQSVDAKLLSLAEESKGDPERVYKRKKRYSQNTDQEAQVRNLTDSIRGEISNTSYVPGSKGYSAPRMVKQDYMADPSGKGAEIDANSIRSAVEDPSQASRDVLDDPVLQHLPWLAKQHPSISSDVYGRFSSVLDDKEDSDNAVRNLFGHLYLTRHGFGDTTFFGDDQSPLSRDAVRGALTLNEDDASVYNMSTLRGARDYFNKRGDLGKYISAIRQVAKDPNISDEEALRMYLQLGRAYNQADMLSKKDIPDLYRYATVSLLNNLHSDRIDSIPLEMRDQYNLGSFPMDVKDKAESLSIDRITNDAEEKGPRSKYNILRNIIPTVPWLTGSERALRDDEQAYDSRGTAGGQQSLGADLPLRYVPDVVRSSRRYDTGAQMSRGYQQSGALSLWDAFGVIPGQEGTFANNPFWTAVAQIASADPALVRMKNELDDVSKVLPAYRKGVEDAFGAVGKDREYRKVMENLGRLAAVPTLLEIYANHSNDPEISTTASKYLNQLKKTSGKGYVNSQKGISDPYFDYNKSLNDAYQFVRGIVQAGLPELPPELMQAYSAQMYNTAYSGGYKPVEGMPGTDYITPSSARIGSMVSKYLRRDAGVEGAAPTRGEFQGALNDYQAIFGNDGLLNGPNKAAYLSNAASIAADKLRERYGIQNDVEGINPILSSRISILDNAAKKLAAGEELLPVEKRVLKIEGADPEDPKTLLGMMTGLDADNIDTIYNALYEGQDPKGEPIDNVLSKLLGEEGAFTDDIARSQKYALYRALVKGLRARLESPEAPDSGILRPALPDAARYSMVRHGKDKMNRRYTNPASMKESAIEAALAQSKPSNKYSPFWSWTDLKPAVERYIGGNASEGDIDYLKAQHMLENIPFKGLYFGETPAKRELAKFMELEDYMKSGLTPIQGMDQAALSTNIDTVFNALKAEGVQSLDELQDPDAVKAVSDLRQVIPFDMPEDKVLLTHGQDRWGAKLYADATDNGRQAFNRGEYDKMPGVLTLANAMTGIDDYEGLEDEYASLKARMKKLSKEDLSRYYDLARQLNKIKANAAYAANYLLWANRRQQMTTDEKRIMAESARRYAKELAEQEELEDYDQFLTNVDKLFSDLDKNDVDYSEDYEELVNSLLYEGTDPRELARYTYPEAFPEEPVEIAPVDDPKALTISNMFPELAEVRDKLAETSFSEPYTKRKKLQQKRADGKGESMVQPERGSLKGEMEDTLAQVLSKIITPDRIADLKAKGYPLTPGHEEGQLRSTIERLISEMYKRAALPYSEAGAKGAKDAFLTFFKSEVKAPILRVKKA